MAADVLAIACDHGALEMKALLAAYAESKGLTVLDLGTRGTGPVDYPDYAGAMAAAIKDQKAARGILLCGTGIGMSMAANRYPFIRAALVHDAFGARMGREHNDANVLVMGGWTTDLESAKQCLDLFLETPFEGGRHQRRVDKMSKTA